MATTKKAASVYFPLTKEFTGTREFKIISALRKKEGEGDDRKPSKDGSYNLTLLWEHKVETDGLTTVESQLTLKINVAVKPTIKVMTIMAEKWMFRTSVYFNDKLKKSIPSVWIRPLVKKAKGDTFLSKARKAALGKSSPILALSVSSKGDSLLDATVEVPKKRVRKAKVAK
jgi:hypothetical protein